MEDTDAAGAAAAAMDTEVATGTAVAGELSLAGGMQLQFTKQMLLL